MSLDTFGIKVGVAAYKEYAGVSTSADFEDAPLLVRLPLVEALLKEWTTDAHLVMYNPVSGDGQDHEYLWRRFNKIALPAIQQGGDDLVCPFICLEWDRPNHKQWSDDPTIRAIETNDFLAQFSAAASVVASKIKSTTEWYAYYFTRAGFRMVYVLKSPVSVSKIEPRILGLISAFREAGLPPDEAACDWTRLFRLPLVFRDSKKAWGEEYAPVFNDKPLITGLEVEEIPEGHKKGRQPTDAAVVLESSGRLNLPLPDKDGAKSLMWKRKEDNSLSQKHMTWWGKTAKKKLEGKPCFYCIWEDVDIATKGARNETLSKYVGSAIGSLIGIPSTTPEHIHALLIDAVENLEPDEKSRMTWPETLWDFICRYWPAEQDKRNALALEIEKETTHTEDSLIEGMREWCDHPDLLSDNKDTVLGFIRRHLVIIHSAARQFYFLQPDGYYSYRPVAEKALMTQLLYHKMNFILPDLMNVDDDGVMHTKPIPQLLAFNAAVIHTIRGESTGKQGGSVRNLGTNGAVFIQPMYRLHPGLRPTFNHTIQQWLLAFGDPRIIDWIALALNFKFRMPMLSIVGPPGIGKSLLVQGIIECLENPVRATEKDLSGQFSTALMMTPFLTIDEGLQEGKSKGKEISAAIREFVGGSALPVEEKFMAISEAFSNGRVIVVANNDDLCATLCGAGRDQSQEDRDAIGLRTIHMNVGKEPEKFLKNINDPKWANGTDLENDYAMARHFLWLKANHKPKFDTSGRFAMVGYIPPSVIKAMEKKTPNVDLIAEVIISMIEKPQPKEVLDCFVVDEAKQSVFVVAAAIAKAFETMDRRGFDKEMSINRIGSVLKWLRKDKTENNISKKLTRSDGTKTPTAQRWTEVSFERLMESVRDYGFPAKRLEKMYKGDIVVEREVVS